MNGSCEVLDERQIAQRFAADQRVHLKERPTSCARFAAARVRSKQPRTPRRASCRTAVDPSRLRDIAETPASLSRSTTASVRRGVALGDSETSNPSARAAAMSSNRSARFIGENRPWHVDLKRQSVYRYTPFQPSAATIDCAITADSPVAGSLLDFAICGAVRARPSVVAGSLLDAAIAGAPCSGAGYWRGTRPRPARANATRRDPAIYSRSVARRARGLECVGALELVTRTCGSRRDRLRRGAASHLRTGGCGNDCSKGTGEHPFGHGGFLTVTG